MGSLDGKTAFIAGAGRDVGRAIAIVMADDVVVHAISPGPIGGT